MQGYLQLTKAEDDIKKIPFRASSSSIYKFMQMPFGLSNAGLNFCRLMEQCLGDQQFITLLLYLDVICIFAPDVTTMLDHIELMLSWLKSFNLKIKPKKWYYFQASMISGSCLVSWLDICQPRIGWQSKGLASAKECQGIPFIPRFGILLPPVHPELSLHGQVSSWIHWSDKCQEK